MNEPTHRRLFLHACVAASAALLALDCAGQSGPAASSAEPAASAPPAAMAELYLLNDSGATLFPGNQTVTDNGKEVASLPRLTYTRLFIAPGPHLLRPEPFLWKQEVKLDAEPGERYYVVIAYRPERSWALPFAGPPLLLKRLTAQEARPLMEQMKMQ